VTMKFGPPSYLQRSFSVKQSEHKDMRRREEEVMLACFKFHWQLPRANAGKGKRTIWQFQ